jgi:hypothetical protein
MFVIVASSALSDAKQSANKMPRSGLVDKGDFTAAEKLLKSNLRCIAARDD